MTVLFLDFDGVLHAPGGPEFEHLPALARVLEAFPEVQIVVSSSWQRDYTVTELGYRLGPLQPRVIGVTGGWSDRAAEILAAAARYGRPWVAIEDDAAAIAQLPAACVVECDTALGLGEAGKLEELVGKIELARLAGAPRAQAALRELAGKDGDE